VRSKSTGLRHGWASAPSLWWRGWIHKRFVYKISCSECVVRGGRNWSAYRPGGDNGFMAAMDRWIFHLNEKHPGADAPCMAFLPAAQQRLHQWREKREAEPTAISVENDT
jgi:hypothetical protein